MLETSSAEPTRRQPQRDGDLYIIVTTRRARRFRLAMRAIACSAFAAEVLLAPPLVSLLPGGSA